jgi:hypothetical protein
MKQIAALAGQVAQPAVITGRLAQLEHRRAEELIGVDVAQMLERNRDGLVVAPEPGEQRDQSLRGGRAGILGIARGDLGSKMRYSFVDVIADQRAQLDGVILEAIFKRRISAETEHL